MLMFTQLQQLQSASGLNNSKCVVVAKIKLKKIGVKTKGKVRDH